MTTILGTILDIIETIKRPAFDTHCTLGRAADNGGSVWIWIPKIDLTATSERVNIDEFERLILEHSGVCVKIALEDVEFLDRPPPAEWSCLLSDRRVWRRASIVARPVLLETFKFNRHYRISTLSWTGIRISLLTDCRRHPLTDQYITLAMKKRRSDVDTQCGAGGLGGEGEQSIPRRVAGVVRQAAGGMCGGDYRSAAWQGFRSVRQLHSGNSPRVR